MAYTVTWDATFEADPEDTDDASTLGTRGREIRKAIRERMDTDDGGASGTGDISWAGDANDGKHYKSTIDGFQTRRDPVDTAHDIEISPGLCRDTDDTKAIELSTVITKQIDNPWMAGDNQGGFPTGITLTADIWYGIFMIRKTSDGSVDAGFDTNLDASALLADATGYLEYRRIGWLRVDGSMNVLSYTQDGDWFFVTVPQLSYEDTLDFRTARTITLDCPAGPGISLHSSLTVQNWTGDSDGIVGTSGQVIDGADPEIEALPGSQFRVASTHSSGVLHSTGLMFPSSTKQVRVHLGGADPSQTVRVYLYGWTDRRGKL
jgi:hypothetical protein